MTQAFNLSQLANKVNTSGQLDVATGVTGTQAVANGGTGQSTYINGELLIGNSTGNTLTKATITAGSGISVTNGSGSITIAASSTGGQLQTEIFTSPGTWTKPASATQVRVTVIGGGGGAYIGSGGYGGLGVSANVPVSAPVSVTVGAGRPGNPGGNGSPGGTSSFGSAVSATGGSGGDGSPGTRSPGSSTVSSGTSLRSGASVNTYTPNPFYGGSFRSGLQGNAAIAYSTSSNFIAGAGGIGGPSAPQFTGGVGGVVIVEYVG